MRVHILTVCTHLHFQKFKSRNERLSRTENEIPVFIVQWVVAIAGDLLPRKKSVFLSLAIQRTETHVIDSNAGFTNRDRACILTVSKGENVRGYQKHV